MRTKRMRLINADKIEFDDWDVPQGNGMYVTVGVTYKYDVDAQPTIEAIPVEWIEKKRDQVFKFMDEFKGARGNYYFATKAHVLNALLEEWRQEQI